MSEPTPSDNFETESFSPSEDGNSHRPNSTPTVGGVLERPGDWVGPFKLLEVIGEGGFGIVWLAERRGPMLQRVALKIIKPGMDSKSVIARFEQERQALALMDHPNVAKVFDGGVTPAGRPYFVMEHVKGEPITTFCDRHLYSIRQRLELFILLCEAVQHAHHKGIIHRDIKPSNVLVTIQDSQVVPKVIDFGIAKAISRSLAAQTVFTEQGQLIGTPEYMSPEQAEMGALDVDTRTDVYSLGVLLYELLVGAVPFESQELRGKGHEALCRVIRESAPPTPVKKLTKLGHPRAVEISKRRSIDEASLKAELRQELQWIPLKAMQKNRQERYFAPKELADDIALYLSGRVPKAGPQSSALTLRKWFARHRIATMICAAVLAVVACVVLVVHAASAEAQRVRLDALAGLRLAYINVGVGTALASDVARNPPTSAVDALADPRLEILLAMMTSEARDQSEDGRIQELASTFRLPVREDPLDAVLAEADAASPRNMTVVRALIDSWSASEWKARSARLPLLFAERVRDERIASLRRAHRATLIDLSWEFTDRDVLIDAQQELIAALGGYAEDQSAVSAAVLTRETIASLEPEMSIELAHARTRGYIPITLLLAGFLLLAPFALGASGKFARFIGVMASFVLAVAAGGIGFFVVILSGDLTAISAWAVIALMFAGASLLVAVASGKRWIAAWIGAVALGCVLGLGMLVSSPYRTHQLLHTLSPESDPLRHTWEP
jgi:serine/threonine protein kinase